MTDLPSAGSGSPRAIRTRLRALGATIDVMTRHRGAVAAVAAVVAVLAAAGAWWVDVQRSDATSTSIDLAVGAVAVVAALLSAPPDGQRLLLASVGVAWWLSSWDGRHLGVLVTAALAATLLAFPDGHVDRRRAALVAVVAVVGLRSTTLSYVALAAAVAFVALRGPRRWAAYPVVAAASLAAIRVLQQLSSDVLPELLVSATFQSQVFLIALALTAIAHVPASRLVAADRAASIVGRLVRSEPEGSDPLLGALREALGDDQLSLIPWDDQVEAYVDAEGRPRQPGPNAIEVLDPGPLVLVESSSSLLGDPSTSRQVQDAVRVTVRAQHRQRERVRQLAQLQQARRRLLAAADDERAAMGRRLETEVLPHLRDASSGVAALPPDDALDVVRSELGLVEGELAMLVAGTAPTELGHGRLVDAVRELLSRTSLRTTVAAPAAWSASTEIERTLFYVVSEAVANVLKHSRAAAVRVELTQTGTEVAATIDDDGIGGADPAGLGLTGLADRLATAGGSLEVLPAPGGGTRLVARAPRSAS